MKIIIEPYNPNWVKQFRKIKEELADILGEFHPVIEHFGSTSIPQLAAKPVIDILVGIEDEKHFPEIEKAMFPHPYIYYQVYNSGMPNRRLFVRLKDEINENKFQKIFKTEEGILHEEINTARIAHVHIWKFGTPDWIRHIAFRDYIKAHPEIKNQYEMLKKELSEQNWKDGNDYNGGKDKFIKTEEAKAIKWYKNQINQS